MPENHAMKRIYLSICLLSLVCAASARADVSLPKVLGDHMVIQQNQPATIWGWAEAGEKVVVEMGESRGETKANADGKWSLKIDPPAAGGPYEIHVVGANTIKLTDVLVGEVWICSGQSNMGWPVNRALNPKEEIAAAKYPNIRLFTVARNPAKEALEDCVGKGQAGWTDCNPNTIPGFSAVGYFFGRKLHQDLDVPVGLVNTSWGGTICEAWTSKPTLESDEDFAAILERSATFKPGNPNQASVLYNGMINPILPLSMRGAIWYQGESNVPRAEQYAKLFPAMITDWRKSWDHGDFPFLFVQLAPYRYGRHNPQACAELWEAQLKTLSLPQTGMAVTTDIGNIKNIHPANKQEVSRRLALWALALAHDKKLVHSGPLYDGLKVEGSKIRISFKHVGGGLKAQGEKGLTHFEIAGADEKFVAATATIDDGSIVVQSDEVAKPVAVRFAWTDTAEPNLFNAEGLPASPFRTDDFKMITADQR
jgi:sialate O-acetylesterase